MNALPYSQMDRIGLLNSLTDAWISYKDLFKLCRSKSAEKFSMQTMVVVVERLQKMGFIEKRYSTINPESSQGVMVRQSVEVKITEAGARKKQELATP